MKHVRYLWKSSLGKKYLMAITGVGLFIFIVFHMMGNLQIFLGQEAINHYGELLHRNVELLWPARIGLLVFVAVHIWTAVALTIENRQTRDQPYEVKQIVAASYASRTMLVSGIILASFVLYHLLHFTLQIEAVNLTGQGFLHLQDEQGRHDIYRMMIIGFRQPWVSLFYAVGVGLMCWHLSHGARAMFQSLGFQNEAYQIFLERFGKVAAVVIFLGYVSVPAAILIGLVN